MVYSPDVRPGVSFGTKSPLRRRKRAEKYASSGHLTSFGDNGLRYIRLFRLQETSDTCRAFLVDAHTDQRAVRGIDAPESLLVPGDAHSGHGTFSSKSRSDGASVSVRASLSGNGGMSSPECPSQTAPMARSIRAARSSRQAGSAASG